MKNRLGQWRKDYGIDARYEGDVGAKDDAQRESLMNEEAIAEAFADFQTRGTETGFGFKVRAALNKVKRFFRQTASGLKGRGFKTWDSIFEGDIATGEAGKRADAGQAPSREEMDRYLQAAWHGSPHKFDKFSTEAIGTGEGAQVFGHGLYFSEKREVADYYREALTQDSTEDFGDMSLSDIALDYWRTGAAPQPPPGSKALKLWADLGQDMSQVVDVEGKHVYERAVEMGGSPVWIDDEGGEALGENLVDAPYVEFDDGSAVLASKSTWRPFGEARKPEHSGATYRVNLAPQEDEYLLWDKPFR